MLTTRDGPVWLVLLAVGLGAAAGGVLRWTISYCFNRTWDVMPLGTLLCNWLGACVIGAVTAYLVCHPEVPAWVRLFVVTGLLGGLTTFSTFSMENVSLLMAGAYLRALSHAGLHLAGSLLSTGIGFVLVETFLRSKS